MASDEALREWHLKQAARDVPQELGAALARLRCAGKAVEFLREWGASGYDAGLVGSEIARRIEEAAALVQSAIATHERAAAAPAEQEVQQ